MPGIIISLVFIFIFSFFVYQMHFSVWDEFAFWGPHAKLIYYNNGLLNISQHAIHQDYPPAGALFYYYFFRLTGYSEGVAFVAQAILLFSPLSILLQGFSWKKIANAITSYVIICSLLVLYFRIFIDPNHPIDVYMDSVVGIFLGMGLTYYFQSKRTALNIIYLSPIFFTFILLKMKLMPLALLALLLIFFDQLLILCRERSREMESSQKSVRPLCRRVSAFALLAISPFFAKLSWQHYLVNTHMLAEWKINLSIRKIVNGIIFNVSDKERLVLHAFIKQTIYDSRQLFLLLSLIVLACFFKRV
ncbi:MAG: hypothetical protein GY821_01465 [Gammaproteobacteria bacterium]|nr:hypothetical protein [Gammaproteobacteria bacterium]